MQLFIQPHGLSFIIKPWASRGILAMYERSCQVHTWRQHTSCCLSLATCLVTWSSDSYHSSESMLPCELPTFSLNRLRSCSLSHRPCSLTVALSDSSTSVSMWTFNHYEIFTVSGQSNKQYTRVRNAVTLVWGSLRVTPTSQVLRFSSPSLWCL